MNLNNACTGVVNQAEGNMPYDNKYIMSWLNVGMEILKNLPNMFRKQ